MARFLKHRKKSTGTVPGSLVFLGEQKESRVQITSMVYNQEALLQDDTKEKADDLPDIPDTNDILWLNVVGLHDTDIIREIGNKYKLHPLLLEDILNTDQRPKHEDFDDALLIIMKKLMLSREETNIIEPEQISLVLKNNILISFQEQSSDFFLAVKNRIRNNKGRIRRSGTDYLAYAMMDTVADNYLNVLSDIGDKIEELEEKAIQAKDKNLPAQIYMWKRELKVMHRAIAPFRDMLLKMLKSDFEYFQKETGQFFRDLLDLSQQALESTETYRDMLSDYYNIYNTGVNNHMNDVMKVLTVFASIFIPLTFIAGVYGTNFDHIPELSYRYAYFIMWAVFLAIIVIMVLYFKRKDWF